MMLVISGPKMKKQEVQNSKRTWGGQKIGKENQMDVVKTKKSTQIQDPNGNKCKTRWRT